MPRDQLRLNPAAVPQIAAAVVGRVAVQQLAIETGLRYADAIPGPRRGCEVACDHDDVIRILGSPEEAHRALFPVLEVDPFEALRLEVNFIQRGLRAIQ